MNLNNGLLGAVPKERSELKGTTAGLKLDNVLISM